MTELTINISPREALQYIKLGIIDGQTDAVLEFVDELLAQLSEEDGAQADDTPEAGSPE